MNKAEFLAKLKEALSGLPKAELDERISFYSEMIDDRMEEGLLEQEAVADVGNVEEIVAQIIEETPLIKIVKEKIRPKKKRKTVNTVLISIGSPVWVPVLISLFAVALSLYVCLWVVVFCIFIAAVALLGCSLGGFAMVVTQMLGSNVAQGIALVGVSFVCIGLGLFMLYLSKLSMKGVLVLTGKIVKSLKKLLMNKGDAQ